MIDDEIFVKKHSLFQRCLPPDKVKCRAFGAGRSGLDKHSEEELAKVLAFDYMGAAEFEHDECAKCLVYMYDNRDKLVATEHDGFYFLSIRQVVKEAHDLWDRLRSSDPGWTIRHKPFTKEAVGWFDFKNGFFVSKEAGMRDNLHKLLLEMTHT